MCAILFLWDKNALQDPWLFIVLYHLSMVGRVTLHQDTSTILQSSIIQYNTLGAWIWPIAHYYV